MASRNELLEQIVIAVGGIVRDPNNRNSLLEDWLLAVDNPVIQRIFINNDEAAGAFYSMATPIVMTGDFEHEFEFQISGTASGNLTIFAGSDIPTDDYFRVDVDNSGFEWKVGGVFVENNSSFTPDTKLHKGVFKRVGSTGSVILDGVEIISTAISIATFTVALIATRANGGALFNGILANPIFNNNGTITSWNLDEATADIEYSNENTFGADIWVNPPNSIQAGWTDDSGGAYTHTGGNSELQLTTGSPLTANMAYRVFITVSGAGNVAVQLGGATVDGNNKISNLSAGTHEVVLSTNSTITFNAVRIISSTECTVSAISIDEVLGNVLTYENQALDQRELFQNAVTQWDNISPPVQQLPAVIEIA